MILLCLLAGILNFFVVCDGYPTLIYSTAKNIRIANVTKSNTRYALLIRDLAEGLALDFCYKLNLICFSDHSLEHIQCANFNGTHAYNRFTLVKSMVQSPEGLACDWVTNKLYWTDHGTNRIEVVSLTGKHRKVLFWEDLDMPRAIALVPQKRIMFWTDWGEVPKIERADMDGSNGSRKVIVSEDLFWPNGLVVDFNNEVIYWVDGKYLFLASVDFDGRNRRKILSHGTTGMDYPYSVTLSQNKLYWTCWHTHSIYELDKNAYNATPKHILHNEVPLSDVRAFDAARQPPVDTPCSKNNGGCSHLCLLSNNDAGYKCACPTGVKLLDQFTCANGSQEFLIVVQRTDISKISLDSPDYTIFKLPLQNVKHAIAVDYDPVEDFMYWTDESNRGIRRAKMNGAQQQDIITTEVQHPDGIAIDWISRNFFWTDTGTDRIEVATLKGLYRKVLINKDLIEPRGIAVAPEHGYIFWSDWSEKPKIERANMDGSDRTLLINDNLGWPNGIVLDLINRKLYWCDAKTDRVESCDFDGHDRREITSDNLSHTFGLSLLGNYLYWTDWSQRSIDRVNRFTSNERQTITEQVPNVMGIKAVKLGDYRDYRGTNPCAFNNGGCSHLCLNRPGNNYTCDCQIGYELTSNLKTCVLPEAFLLYSRRETIGKISIENHNNGITLPITGVKFASGLDFDKNDGRIYWTDTKMKTITRAFINGSEIEKIVESGLDEPQGIAVDWVSHNIYWIDRGNKRIEVSRMNGTSRRVLIWKDTDEPNSLALDPGEGYMYWSDSGRSGTIKRASMDGRNVINLVTNVGHANGLTIDDYSKKLYWTSSKPSIESCNLDGSNRTEIITTGLAKPTSLSQFQDYIYWTDWETGVIEAANKTTGGNRTVIHNHLNSISDILVYHNRRQSGWNQCAVNNGGCSHLCLPLPNNNYTCHCPLHYNLVLVNETKTCVEPRTFLLFSQKNSIHRLVPDTSDCPDMILPIQGLKNVRAIEFDPISQHLYWIDGKSQSIKRSDLESRTSTVVNLADKNSHPYDLALDPYSRLLFWSCATSDVINVTRIDKKVDGPVEKYAVESILRNISFHKPRNLALHPERGLIFWIDVEGNHKIMKSRLDGWKKEILIGNLTELSSIAVDRDSNRLYFAHGKQIDSMDLNGQMKRKLLDHVEAESLSVHKNFLYFVSRDQHVIERVRLNGDSKTAMIKRSVLARVTPTDLVSVQFPSMDKLKSHPCTHGKEPGAGCSHICMSVDPEPHNTLYGGDIGYRNKSKYPLYNFDEPELHNGLEEPEERYDDGRHAERIVMETPHPPAQAQCFCPIGMGLTEDKKTCEYVPACGPDDFTCVGKISTTGSNCVPLMYKCDGQPDCLDSSDELGCPKCGINQFKCYSDGKCINSVFVCDRQNQCEDGSDEAHCCKIGEFRCASTGSCHECHSWNSCPDSVDEPDNCKIKPVHDPHENRVDTYVIGISIAILCAIVLSVLIYYCRSKVSRLPGITLPGMDDSAGDSLALKPLQNGSIPKQRMQDSGRMSMFSGSTTSNSYDRNHITGASSSSTSNGMCSGVGIYPAETLNPPPSPATTAESRRCCVTNPSRYRPYRHYRAINQAPHPTPCSTDVCDDSDYGYRPQTESEYMTYSRGTASECDSDPFPPPPTPSSCPPSPSSTYFNPLPPPPPSPDRHCHYHPC